MGRLVNISIIRLIALCCLLGYSSYGQVGNNNLGHFKGDIPKEKISITVNDSIIIAGGELYYKLYCMVDGNKGLSNFSKVAYVELIGDNNVVLFTHKHRLEKGITYGDFFVPPTVKTGNYKLVAYTKWMKNNPDNSFFKQDINIINPFISEKNVTINADSLQTSQIEIAKTNKQVSAKTEDGINILSDLSTYKNRSKATITINNVLGESNYGNYAISIRKVSSIEAVRKNGSKRTVSKNEPLDSIKFIPEVRGEIISGKVVSKQDGTFVSNKIVALSIPGSNYVYKNVKTDLSGRFYFNVYENYDDNKAIIQVIGDNKERYSIVLDDITFKYNNELEFKNLTLNPNIKDWLIQQSIYDQIENAYHDFKQDSLIIKKPNHLFYGNPTAKYKLDDYTRFPTLRETFVEIIKEAAIREDKDSYKFKVYNYNERTVGFPSFEPLVLFDGVLIQNGNDIIDYDVNKIDEISIVMGIYFYGPSIYNGIIDIKSKKGDFRYKDSKGGMLNFNLSALKSSKKYYMPNYNNNSLGKLDRIPDYRVQLLWLPEMFLNSDKKTVDFYTSDVEGTYEILLDGFTLKGNHVVSKQYIEVNNN
ncbi:hypothetical protein [Yeosuana aromativorans]|uniref:hypothetical protein n=1 Tax=Yeosuana aromativorans TaxID=288019 RepID=UPI0016634795|nr:hypothetical protein [Yeosuana aromativorans]